MPSPVELDDMFYAVLRRDLTDDRVWGALVLLLGELRYQQRGGTRPEVRIVRDVEAARVTPEPS